ncbi:phosphoglycerate dehydrogenase [Staphylococcus arlettae]|uniref:phosphoglycerate dehydrogenase n=1 Tax=Staphylococcus arlettae TaxID=29378 RepID=UPI001E37170E|nr:phosphoglycerate dehydrogenase [Staphylococcus arlettae]MCD8850484.1 phosphoglycerate dehydrogenase [Staphylococcus arlettae]MCD8908313.1 phosphoglycerate dehydrogenase [Staphylococcus arlettae]MEB6067378.1 phosphoglycerate dehydrogenase [Staphylococcus arlettae]
MKAVSLKRLGQMEEVLIDTFPTVDFVFTEGVSAISINDRKTLDILFGHDSSLDETFLQECPNLKWLAWYSTGVNKLPLDYLSKNEIVVTNGKGVHAKQMSEFIIGYLLADYKKMRTSYINQQQHKYDSKLTGKRLNGESILFIGTGSIAQKTAKVAQAIDMKVLGVNTTGKKAAYFDEVFPIIKLDQAVTQADIVVNCLPETSETVHLLTKQHFKLMNEHTLFMNVGRGTIVKHEVLIDVLEQKLIRHAYLDVFEREPLPANDKLYELDNVTLTAHITGNGTENAEDITEIFKKNLQYFLNYGKIIENQVDLKKGY